MSCDSDHPDRPTPRPDGSHPLHAQATLPTREQAALERGCKIVLPRPNELQIDIDTEERFQLFLQRFADVLDDGRVAALHSVKPSRSGLPHRHATVELFNPNGSPMDVTPWQRIALQFALGSDVRRESYSVRRLLLGEEHPTCFFEVAP